MTATRWVATGAHPPAAWNRGTPAHPAAAPARSLPTDPGQACLPRGRPFFGGGGIIIWGVGCFLALPLVWQVAAVA